MHRTEEPPTQDCAAILEYTHADPKEAAVASHQDEVETKRMQSPMAPHTIFIDGQAYLISWKRVSGSDIRNLTLPPIGPNKELFLEFNDANGPRDLNLRDSDSVELNPLEEPPHFITVSKPVTQKAANEDDPVMPRPTHDEIAERAYYLYVQEGCMPNRELENWLTAESQLKAEYSAHHWDTFMPTTA